jgi:hypothetical protein
VKLRNNVLIKRLFKGLHQLCNSTKAQWVTLLLFSNQKRTVALRKHWQNYKRKGTGASADSEHSQPMCDANDVRQAMLATPFALDGLTNKELNYFNSQIMQGSRTRAEPQYQPTTSTCIGT